MNVMVPVGLDPPARVAVSSSVTGEVESVTEGAEGLVERTGVVRPVTVKGAELIACPPEMTITKYPPGEVPEGMVTVGAGKSPPTVAKKGVGELSEPGTQLTKVGLGFRQAPYGAPGMYSAPPSVVTVPGGPDEAEREDTVGTSWTTVNCVELTTVLPYPTIT